MPRLNSLTAQSFNSRIPLFDSGYVADGDFSAPSLITNWARSNFTGSGNLPFKTSNNQVEFANNAVLSQTIGGLPTNTTFTLSFYVYTLIDAAPNNNGVYVIWVTAGVTEIRTFIRNTGLITATVNNATSSSATIEFRCVGGAGSQLIIDRVALV